MLLSVHKEIRAKDLKGIFNLPNYDDNQLVKITIEPTEEKKTLTPEERKEVWRKIDEIMELFIDSNVVLDYTLERELF